jgi:hypothetical protein
LNHASLSDTLSTSTNTIDNNPQGNIKKEEGLADGDMIDVFFIKEKGKN